MANELPAILWSIRTIEKGATGKTPFMLVYGSKGIFLLKWPFILIK